MWADVSRFTDDCSRFRVRCHTAYPFHHQRAALRFVYQGAVSIAVFPRNAWGSLQNHYGAIEGRPLRISPNVIFTGRRISKRAGTRSAIALDVELLNCGLRLLLCFGRGHRLRQSFPSRASGCRLVVAVVIEFTKCDTTRG